MIKFEEKNKVKVVIIISVIIFIVVGIIIIRNGAVASKIEQQEKRLNSNLSKDTILVNQQDNVTWNLDANRKKVPVPKGYIGSNVIGENKVETGYVIYEGTEVFDSTDEREVKKAQNERNQFVWVPIEDIDSMYGIDENGKMWGKLYEFTTKGVEPLNWNQENGIMYISKKTGYREPDTINSQDTNKQLDKYNVEIGDIYGFKSQLEKEFEQMILSVQKYGGFYIGRYETGNLSQNTPVVTKQNSDIHGQTWYIMYQRSKNIAKENKNVVTSMMWGCQWDATLKWLEETGSKTWNEIENSSNWGNYLGTQLEYENTDGTLLIKPENSSIRLQTGSSEQTKANNIYDMAGNVCDRTIEANSTFLRIGRRRTLF